MVTKCPDLPEAMLIYTFCLDIIVNSAPPFILKSPELNDKLRVNPTLIDIPATYAFVMVGGFN